MPAISATDIGARIVAVAARFVGLTEIAPNAKWDDLSTPGPDQRAADLAKLLALGGWEPGAAYCASFVRGVWMTACQELGAPAVVLATIRRQLSPSVMQTFTRNQGAVERVPVVGSMMLLQFGKSDRGHAGIVVQANAESYWTIDANTSGVVTTAAKEREGEGVYRKPPRKLDFTRRPGLWLRGFLPPPTW